MIEDRILQIRLDPGHRVTPFSVLLNLPRVGTLDVVLMYDEPSDEDTSKTLDPLVGPRLDRSSVVDD